MIVLALTGPGEPGLLVGNGFEPLVKGEQGRALARQHDVGRPVHHRAGGHDRIAEALQGGDGPGLARRAVHQTGVQLIGTRQIG